MQKAEKYFFFLSQTLNAIFLAISKGSLGIYYSQINTWLTEVCLLPLPGVPIIVEKGRQNCLSESPEELVQRWCFFAHLNES